MTKTEFDQQLAEANANIATAQAKLALNAGSEPSWWSVHDAMTISASVLVFGVLVFLLAAFMLRGGRSSDSALKLLGTLLIIVVSVFLVVAGYSDKQIAPVMGLLGTIAGYLLGKGSVDIKDQQRNEPTSQVQATPIATEEAAPRTTSGDTPPKA